jgi:hypothetical protein
MYFVFCRLSPSPPSHHGHVSVWLLLVICLRIGHNRHFPYDWRVFVGPKKKTTVGLLVFNPFWSRPSITSYFSPLRDYYCKRAIICLSSSKIVTPTSLSARRVCTVYPPPKGIGPSPTLAWPGWKQPDIPVEVDTGRLETDVGRQEF